MTRDDVEEGSRGQIIKDLIDYGKVSIFFLILLFIEAELIDYISFGMRHTESVFLQITLHYKLLQDNDHNAL